MQFVAKSTTKLAVELWFDVTTDANGGDVRAKTAKVGALMQPKKGKGKGKQPVPPGVRFHWGTFLFEGVIESMDETLEFFSPDGKPLRAHVTLSLTSQDDPVTSDAKERRAASPGAEPRTQMRAKRERAAGDGPRRPPGRVAAGRRRQRHREPAPPAPGPARRPPRGDRDPMTVIVNELDVAVAPEPAERAGAGRPAGAATAARSARGAGAGRAARRARPKGEGALMPGTPALYAARPSVQLDNADQSALTGALVSARIEETAGGCTRCEATFGNWGIEGGGIGFLYFDRALLDFGKTFTLRMGAGDAEGELFHGRISALEARFPQATPPSSPCSPRTGSRTCG